MNSALFDRAQYTSAIACPEIAGDAAGFDIAHHVLGFVRRGNRLSTQI